jgi:glucose-1-phosphate thymidylyltransferase
VKGVILAGGTGSRLFPLTRITNKHLLPVYDKPMICHSIQALNSLGIEEVILVVGGNYSGEFLRLLGDGHEYNVRITYVYQEKSDGIAGALKLTRRFLSNEKNFVVMLGDNAFEHQLSVPYLAFAEQEQGARLILSQVRDIRQLCQSGVAKFDSRNRIIEIIEKPIEPSSSLVVTGVYFYDWSVFNIISNLQPSARGELEITDVNNEYIRQGLMEYDIVSGYWADFGASIDAYYDAIDQVRNCGINKA